MFQSILDPDEYNDWMKPQGRYVEEKEEMIVTTGRIIKIEVCKRIIIQKSCEGPGAIRVTNDGESITLPGNKEEAQRFVNAYLHAVNADIEYRKMEAL